MEEVKERGRGEEERKTRQQAFWSHKIPLLSESIKSYGGDKLLM